MTTFALVTTIVSLVLMAGFSALSIVKFGWQLAYSSFSSKWMEAVPMHNVNLWSIVTFFIAVLLMPAMIEVGEGSVVQFLGFFAPLYLLVAAFTPKWETDKKQGRIHFIGTVLCATVSIAWIIFVAHLWWVLPIGFVAAAIPAYFTKTYKTSWVFWLEMAAFTSVYLTVFIKG
jgi:hypothetical protein